jgi:hypothetical protein
MIAPDPYKRPEAAVMLAAVAGSQEDEPDVSARAADLPVGGQERFLDDLRMNSVLFVCHSLPFCPLDLGQEPGPFPQTPGR